MPSKTIVAMVCITILLVTALIMGVNGVLLAGGVAALAGLGGYAKGKTSK
ncbi:hypothetical protein ES703_67097 [subsurface metagenome]